MKTAIGLTLAALLISVSAVSQEKAPPPGSVSEDCMKHCRQVAEAKQKALDARKAEMEKMDAVFRDVRAQLDVARTARGDKKVAALEAAIEKLVSFHESMRQHMTEMGGGPGHPPMAAFCCAGRAALPSCCAEMAATGDCPMMAGGATGKN